MLVLVVPRFSLATPVTPVAAVRTTGEENARIIRIHLPRDKARPWLAGSTRLLCAFFPTWIFSPRSPRQQDAALQGRELRLAFRLDGFPALISHTQPNSSTPTSSSN